MKNEKMYIELEGYDVLERSVKADGGSSSVILPKSWLGARVKVISVDNTKDKRDKRKTTIPLKKCSYQIYGYESLTKIVKKRGSTAYVLLPKSWIGKYVKVILIDNPLQEKIDENQK